MKCFLLNNCKKNTFKTVQQKWTKKKGAGEREREKNEVQVTLPTWKKIIRIKTKITFDIFTRT